MTHKFMTHAAMCLPTVLPGDELAEYNEALRRRGGLTIWFEVGVADLWSAPCA